MGVLGVGRVMQPVLAGDGAWPLPRGIGITHALRPGAADRLKICALRKLQAKYPACKVRIKGYTYYAMVVVYDYHSVVR